jgi:hypothetical protein
VTLFQVVILAGLFLFLVYRLLLRSERKKWNNGICSECNNGYWKSFDMDSQGGTGYECTNCNEHIWIDFPTHMLGDSVDELADDAIVIIKEW